MDSLKKIGIMGGTFNPIHIAHLILAENAWEQFELDKVYFMPSKMPPHKDNKEIASPLIRMNMIEMAISGNPHFEAYDFELKMEGITYTADTLQKLTRQNRDTSYYYIIGADSLFQIETWKNPEIIFSLCHVIAASRNDVPESDMKAQMNYLKEKYHASIDLLYMPEIQISSHEIREALRQNKTIRYYVPASVAEYIKQNNLYTELFFDKE